MYNFSDGQDSIAFPQWAASIIDFNSLPPSVYADYSKKLDLKECHASLCDEDGQLMLVSNGQTIYAGGVSPIINGDTINFGRNWEGFTREFPPGIFETTGFRAPQQIGYIPQPETDTILAVYQNIDTYLLDSDNNYIELWYAKLVPDVEGQFSVISKDLILNDKIYSNGKITACKHGNGRDWWLLQFNRDTLYTYIIEPSGIRIRGTSLLPITVVKNTLGQSKFSPDGSKYAYYGVRQFDSVDGAQIMVSDFDRCTGRLLNPQAAIVSSVDNLVDNGIEFSPSSDLVYLSSFFEIRQLDLTADDIFASSVVISEHNGINNCSVDNGLGPFSFGQMQLGPDNKIYISLAAQCNDVHVIHSPDVRGVDCNMEQNAIILPTFTMGTIPTFNTNRLGPLDGSSCDTLGIDNNPVSRFWYEQDSLDYLTVQFWDVSYFRPEDWAWDFGDGISSTAKHPVHSYEEKGTYEVCLTVSNENSGHTSCQTLYLGVSSNDDLEEKITVSLFPNPTEDKFRIVIQDYLPEAGRLTLYDLTGKALLSSNARTGATIVDISAFTPGTYIYELRDGQQLLKSGKVVRL